MSPFGTIIACVGACHRSIAAPVCTTYTVADVCCWLSLEVSEIYELEASSQWSGALLADRRVSAMASETGKVMDSGEARLAALGALFCIPDAFKYCYRNITHSMAQHALR